MLKNCSNKQGKVSQIDSRSKNKFWKNIASLAVVGHVKSKEMVELKVFQLESIWVYKIHICKKISYAMLLPNHWLIFETREGTMETKNNAYLKLGLEIHQHNCRRQNFLTRWAWNEKWEMIKYCIR